MYIRAYEQSLMNYGDYVAHRHILLIIPPVLLVIGTFGNLFSFCILFQKRGKYSTYNYLSALALLDLLVLYIGLLRLWFGQFMIDILNTNNILCKVGVFLGYVCSDTSVWLIVTVTIERCIAVMFPLRAPTLCNVRNARVAILSIISVFVAVNCHFLWSVELHYYKYNSVLITKCHATTAFTYLVDEIWPWVDAAIYSFVPFLIITLLNSFIIKHIVSARHVRNMLRQQSSLSHRNASLHPNQKQNEASKRITITLLAVSFTFLITTLPMNLVLIYTSSVDTIDQDDDATFAKRQLIGSVAEMLMYVNHSVNFILYCMTGKKFRDQFKALACWCHKSQRFRGHSQRFETTTFRLSTMTTYKTADRKMNLHNV